MDNKKETSELRQDPVSGDWVIISTGRAKRPEAQRWANRTASETPLAVCPFENPQASGNGPALLIYNSQGETGQESNWATQVIKNNFPIVDAKSLSPERRYGPYLVQFPASGSHEVVITRDHKKSLGLMEVKEILQVIKVYKERYSILKDIESSNYILIFHNHGREAGASISHPHSQIMALPFVPADIKKSLTGSQKYHEERRRCVHCDLIAWCLQEKHRVVFENETMLAMVPYVPKFSYEIRIFPKEHRSYFEELTLEESTDLAEALKISLAKIYHGLNNPPYNFFIHTAPAGHDHAYDYYHWHLEIDPRLNTWGGFELGTGGDVIDTDPNEAAKYLRSIKI